MDSPDLLLPEGSVLLHIGPYKTGSTAIQYALHEQRNALQAHDVLYPGTTTTHRQRRPGWAVLGATPRGHPVAKESEWVELVEEVRAARQARVCISTESFAMADESVVKRIVGDLGPERLHIVAVVRRLDRLLPSQWQERVKTSRETRAYQDWLAVVLDEGTTDKSAKSFWGAHRVDVMLARWSAVLPIDQITLIVADEHDRGLLPRAFESMLGLPSGLLIPPHSANASLTAEKSEVLRRINIEFAENGWPDEAYFRMVKRGARAGLIEAAPSSVDVRIPPLTPSAAERVAALSVERIEAIKFSGVRVVGDLERLRAEVTPTGPDQPPDAPEAISVEAAVRAVDGTVRGALGLLARERRQHRRALRAPRTTSLEDVPTRALARALAGRVRSRLRRRLLRGR